MASFVIQFLLLNEKRNRKKIISFHLFSCSIHPPILHQFFDTCIVLNLIRFFFLVSKLKQKKKAKNKSICILFMYIMKII